MRVGQAARWLIKSSTKIIGPYTDRQVMDLLREQVLKPIDEASLPNQRWIFVRDEPIFAKVLEEVRQKNIRGVLDENSTRIENTSVTQVTQASTPSDELTVEISQASIDEINQIQDVNFHSVEDKNTTKSAAEYTYAEDPKLNLHIEKSVRWAWIGAIIAISAALAFVLFNRFVASPIKEKREAEKAFYAGMQAIKLGDYSFALQQLEQAKKLSPEQMQADYYLGLLKVQWGDQSFSGRQILENLLESPSEDIKRVRNAIGLSYLQEGDYVKAENEFNQVLDIDPVFESAVINLGAVAIATGDWARAQNHLLLAIKDGSRDGVEYLMFAEAMSQLYENENDDKYLVEAKNLLQTYINSNQNYKLEVQVALAYINRLLKDDKEVYLNIDNILDSDLDLTENIRQDLLIYHKKMTWTKIAEWCLKLTKDLEPTGRVIMLEAVCLVKSRDQVAASQKLNEALSKSPTDQLVLTVGSYIFAKMNMQSQANVTLERAIKEQNVTPILQSDRMQAKNCFNQQYKDCQMSILEKYYAQAPNNLDSISYLGYYYLQNNELDQANKYLDMGLKLSDRYIPLLRLETQIKEIQNSKL